MKRTPLKRSNGPKRTRMKPGKHKSKYAMRERDYEFMAFVRSLPCILAGLGLLSPCSGVVEADHAGERGAGQKATDNTCIPLCKRHHWDRHNAGGFFRGGVKGWKRVWCQKAIAKTQAEYEAAQWFQRELDGGI